MCIRDRYYAVLQQQVVAEAQYVGVVSSHVLGEIQQGCELQAQALVCGVAGYMMPALHNDFDILFRHFHSIEPIRLSYSI